MKNLIMVILTIRACFALNIGFAQSPAGQIGGRITDVKQLPVAAGTLSLIRMRDSVIVQSVSSTANGRFNFVNLKNGSYRLTAGSVGFVKYYSGEIKIDAGRQNITLPDIRLISTSTVLSEVVVTSQKSFIEEKIDRTVVNVDALISNAGTTALEVLEKSPGVQVDENGSISLKGQPGVVVFIDDKPTYLSGSDLQNYLRSLPSSTLDKVEIMTNPPARYDAAGNAGIINIKTKKRKIRGFNMGLSLAARQAKNITSNNSADFNYRNNKVNIFGTLGYIKRNSYNDVDIYRRYFLADGTTSGVFNQSSYIRRLGYGFSSTLGADFNASEKTTLGIVFTGLLRYPETQNSSRGVLKNAASDPESSLLSNNSEKGIFKNGGVNINYRRQLKKPGSEVSANLDYLIYSTNTNQDFNNYNYSPTGELTSYDHSVGALPSQIKIYAAKTDYSQPLQQNWKLEAGLKKSYTKTGNVANYFNVINNVTIPDYNLTNNFDYKENINAGYININKDFKRLSIQAGIRVENTFSSGFQLGNAMRSDSSFKRNYTNAFPTIFMLYKLDSLGDNQLKLNYGRRIDRPYYQDLNPFITQIDKFTYYVGNPYLKPSFSDKVEIGYLYKNLFGATLSYSDTKDDGNETIQIIDGIYYSKPANIGRIKTAAIALNSAFEPAKWFSFQLNAQLAHVHSVSEFYTGLLNTRGTSVYLQGLLQFKLGHDWNMQWDGNFQSRQISNQFVIGSKGRLNAGFSKKLLSHAAVKLSVSDILRTNINRGAINNLQLTEANFRTLSDSRAVLLSLSLRFGKAINNKSNHNDNSADTEQGRVKN
jgi:iron complex outermembrane receptor protein